MSNELQTDADAEFVLVASELSQGIAPLIISALHGIPPARITAIMAHPRTVAAMRAHLDNQFEMQARPCAQVAALKLLRDPETNGLVLARVALGIMDQSRRREVTEAMRPSAHKTMENMTPGEIQALLHTLSVQADAVAKRIEGQQNPIETEH